MHHAPVFTDWKPETASSWHTAELCLGHRLHRDPLFSMDALAHLIERYPREHYALVEMGPQGSSRRLWREGDIGGLKGADVIEAIAKGRLWLNMRRVDHVAPEYAKLLTEIFGELSGYMPGFESFNETCGILISSPNAQVYYHADLPGQSLWQIHGRKRVYVYPNQPPYLTPEQLENIALFEVEVDMPYDPSYDKAAKVFEIEPGQMLHWPLNAPHRVENLDCLNVSMTVEYWTEAIRRSQMVTLANGIMRHKLGLRPASNDVDGAAFWSKAALQAAWRRAGLLRRERKARRPVTFHLDPGRPGHVVDIAGA